MIKFAPSGNEDAFYEKGFKNTEDSISYVKELNLDGFEYSFTHGVRMGDERAIEIGNFARAKDIEISCHSPYYINFANPDDDMARKSFGYVLDSLRKLKLLQGKRCVLHMATQGKATREEAFALAMKRMEKLSALLDEEGFDDFFVCPETMGKIKQIGTVDEIIAACKIDKRFIPCIDFGHINSREQGSLKDYDDFKRIIDKLFSELPEEKVKNIHVHFSKIEYGKSGEIRHLDFSDDSFGPPFLPMLKVLYDYKISAFVVCESRGFQARDAKVLKDNYLKIV